MSKHWPPPQYEVEIEVGLPHERQFTIGCLVLKYREVGMGKSKKIAKRQAAQKMWERLQSQPLDQTEIVQSCIDDANDEVSCSWHIWEMNMMGLSCNNFGESFTIS
jgi:RISC-loading complex subunit TARBP2